jgi:succinyl-diaminopimelate desuccinylase
MGDCTISLEMINRGQKLSFLCLASSHRMSGSRSYTLSWMNLVTDITALEQSRIIAILERLVGFDTQNPPGREAEAAAWLQVEMAGMGFGVETSEVLPDRTNVVGIIENGPGPSFAFNTHIDVVPAGDGWISDAFVLRMADDRLYGRGACDAKGPLAAMLEAMRWLAMNRDRWCGTLVGAFVADEEASSRGAKAYVRTKPKIDYCIIGEPTSCTTYSAHKGSMRPLVRVHGMTAHSGMPDLGVNAILKSACLLDLVAREHRRLQSLSHPLVGSPSLTVTRTSAGIADNVVPDRCDLLLDRRMIPGEEEEAVRREISNLVSQAAKEAGTAIEIVDFRPTTGGPTETRADHPIVSATQNACRQHHGHDTPLSGFQGGCDLVHFRSIGAQGVVLGPGALEVAHQPNEYVPVPELVMAAAIYRDVALTMLGEGRTPVFG